MEITTPMTWEATVEQAEANLEQASQAYLAAVRRSHLHLDWDTVARQAHDDLETARRRLAIARQGY